jgi:hypothetical protein
VINGLKPGVERVSLRFRERGLPENVEIFGL